MFTTQKWNFQIWIKIEQEICLYFSKLFKSLIQGHSAVRQVYISQLDPTSQCPRPTVNYTTGRRGLDNPAFHTMCQAIELGS